MEMHFIEENPMGDVYKNLVDYAMRTSDAFMLVYRANGRGELTDKQKEIRPCLAPYRLKTRHNLMWPGIIYRGFEGCIFDENSYIDIYRTSDELLPLLYEPGGLFNWSRDYPDDLCFFRKGECWLTTTGHEKIGYIACQTKEDETILSLIGVRHKITNCTPELFFEEYKLD